MTDSILLKLKGTPIANPALPGIFSDSSRDATATVSSQFLPDGYLKIKDAFDVSQRARSIASGAVENTSPTEDKDVVVLEMADGVTVITSAKKLRESLARVQPAARRTRWYPEPRSAARSRRCGARGDRRRGQRSGCASLYRDGGRCCRPDYRSCAAQVG